MALFKEFNFFNGLLATLLGQPPPLVLEILPPMGIALRPWKVASWPKGEGDLTVC